MLLLTAITPWVYSDLKPLPWVQFGYVVAQIGLSFSLEFFNAFLMFYTFYKPNNLRVRHYSKHCFKDTRFCLICLVVTVCLLINPFAAFETYLEDVTYA